MGEGRQPWLSIPPLAVASRHHLMGAQGQLFPGCKWGKGTPRVSGQVSQGMGGGRELACLAA